MSSTQARAASRYDAEHQAEIDEEIEANEAAPIVSWWLAPVHRTG